MRDLLSELTKVLDQGRDCVYCSVVETRGSTPQKAGAAMLVFPDGGQTGTLGGGCVEAEVRQRALRSMGSGKAEVHTFNLDDNYGWDDGLICGGRMSILADPLASPQARERQQTAQYYHRYRSFVDSGQGCTEAIVMSEQPTGLPVGSRFLFDPSGQLSAAIGTDTSETAVAIVRRHLVPVQRRPKPAVHQGIAYLPILPRITLLIVGGGHVGQAVARLAVEVDFDIWILDDRERYASQERFPMAERRLVGDIGANLKHLAAQVTPSLYASSCAWPRVTMMA